MSYAFAKCFSCDAQSWRQLINDLERVSSEFVDVEYAVRRGPAYDEDMSDSWPAPGREHLRISLMLLVYLRSNDQSRFNRLNSRLQQIYSAQRNNNPLTDVGRRRMGQIRRQFKQEQDWQTVRLRLREEITADASETQELAGQPPAGTSDMFREMTQLAAHELTANNQTEQDWLPADNTSQDCESDDRIARAFGNLPMHPPAGLTRLSGGERTQLPEFRTIVVDGDILDNPPARTSRTQNTRQNNRSSYPRTPTEPLITRRQREAAARRAALQEAANQARWEYDWQSTTTWKAAGPNNEVFVYPIAQMDSQHLWQTICWLVTNQSQIYLMHNPRPQLVNLAVAAARWLAYRPAFRALVKEASRRRMTFPQSVFRYLCEQLGQGHSTTIKVATPWDDPALYGQLAASSALQNIVLDPPVTDDVDNGRELRGLDFNT